VESLSLIDSQRFRESVWFAETSQFSTSVSLGSSTAPGLSADIVGFVIVGTVGSLLLIVVLIVIVVCLRKRRNGQRRKDGFSSYRSSEFVASATHNEMTIELKRDFATALMDTSTYPGGEPEDMDELI
jgi:hypothetical protein